MQVEQKSLIKNQKGTVAKRLVIIEIAASMFRNKGYRATTMRDIAETIGIEAASLYNHISSKSDILIEITETIKTECHAQLMALDSESLSNIDKIEAIIRFHIQLICNNFDFYMVASKEWIHLDENKYKEYATHRRGYVQEIEAIIQGGIDKNEIKPIIPYVAVLTILSAITGLEYWQRTKQRYSAEEMEEHMVLMLLQGLKS